MNFMSNSPSSPFQLRRPTTTTTAAASPPPDTEYAGEAAVGLLEKEHMFDKVVTPSDVGKLNRLVIPKQYAEKYFPLDSSTHEKGLFLNFEDRNGKPWRIRYSYWNSSQSYVMTKGWSRFVKEKKLDAGDIVSFQRGLGDLSKHRLFIDCRRRPDDHLLHQIHPSFPLLQHHHQRSLIPWTSSCSYPSFYSNAAIVNGNPCHLSENCGFNYYGPQQYLGISQMQRRGCNNGGRNEQQIVFDSVPVVQGRKEAAKKKKKKRLRLFGVDMDYCTVEESEELNNLGFSSKNAAFALAHHIAAPLMHSCGGGLDVSSSSPSVPSLQLRPCNDDDDDVEDGDKGKGASMSLNHLDI